jgi:hypothetical protein
MRTFGRIIGVLGKVDVFFAGLFIAANLIIIFLNEGWSKVQEIMSPFNLINFVLIIVTLAPGFGLIMWSDKIEKKIEDGGLGE